MAAATLQISGSDASYINPPGVTKRSAKDKFVSAEQIAACLAPSFSTTNLAFL